MGTRQQETRRVIGLLGKWQPAIRDAFIEIVRVHATSINLAALAAAIEVNDIERAVSLAGITPAVAFELDRAIVGAYVASGQKVRDEAPKFAATFGFDGRADRAQQWAATQVGGLISDITADQADMIRQVIVNGIAQGRGPRSVAVDIAGRVNNSTGRREGGLLGLTSGQAQTVNAVRADLENLDRRYFTRTLRNARFDGIVMRAINEGKPLSAVDIERITAAYSDRALKHRADVIARSESITALRAGRHEGFLQAIEQGAVAADRVARRWSATLDARTRDDHVSMDGQEVTGMDAPFTFPDGSMAMFPGDGSLGAPAEQLAQCRCFQEYNVDWLRA